MHWVRNKKTHMGNNKASGPYRGFIVNSKNAVCSAHCVGRKSQVHQGEGWTENNMRFQPQNEEWWDCWRHNVSTPSFNIEAWDEEQYLTQQRNTQREYFPVLYKQLFLDHTEWLMLQQQAWFTSSWGNIWTYILFLTEHRLSPTNSSTRS